jgi:DNA-binding MarR family transcriptional regulator
MSHAGLNALAVIEGAGRPLTPGEVGATMHITSGSITSLIDTLQKQGLVTRAAHDDDRRKVLLDVTEAGNDLLDVVLPEVQMLCRELLRELNDQEQATLLSLLQRVATSVAGVSDDEIPPPAPRRNPRRPS